LDRRDIIWQQTRKELRRQYFREVADYEAARKSQRLSAERLIAGKPIEPDYNQQEEDFYRSSQYIDVLAKHKEEITAKSTECLKGLRKFINKLGSSVSQPCSMFHAAHCAAPLLLHGYVELAEAKSDARYEAAISIGDHLPLGQAHKSSNTHERFDKRECDYGDGCYVEEFVVMARSECCCC
jgi:hypothetical protein